MFLNTKDQSCNSWDFQRNEKNVVPISVAPGIGTLVRNLNLTSDNRGTKNTKLSEIIFHVGSASCPQSWIGNPFLELLS